MKDQLSDFDNLWTVDKDKFLLFQVDKGEYVIVERATKMALLIEDDDVAKDVVRRMLEAGVEVVDSL